MYSDSELESKYGAFLVYLDDQQAYETRRDKIVVHAWETWTQNGNRMDAEMRFETECTVKDAVGSTYYDGIDDIEWLNATLQKLGVGHCRHRNDGRGFCIDCGEVI